MTSDPIPAALEKKVLTQKQLATMREFVIGAAHPPLTRDELHALLDTAEAQATEIERLRKENLALHRTRHEVEQTLGKVLGYPELYPHVSDTNDGQVCIGEHVTETIASEAANRITRLQVATEALEWLENESYDLRSLNVPTGGDDYDIEWAVVSHHMAEPQEREEGRG